MAPLVLIIEDEAILRVSMARGLARLPGIEVAEAGTLDAAIAVIDQRPPALVFSDIDLPGRSGLELLGELGRRNLSIPVIFISAYLKAYASQIPRHANVDLREKPIGLAELRELVLKHVSTPPADVAAEPFEATDYIQLACMGQRSVVIELGGTAEKTRGQIVICAGEVWCAEDAQGRGEDAFRRLVTTHGLSVRCLPLRGVPSERDVHHDWEGLLLDAVREDDEARRDEAIAAPPPPELPPWQPPPFPEPPAPPADFETVWQRGVTSLREKNYPAALGAFLEAKALRPDDWRVRANLERLRQLGHEAAIEDQVIGSE
jgi:CheY-like chemotaxis protein